MNSFRTVEQIDEWMRDLREKTAAVGIRGKQFFFEKRTKKLFHVKGEKGFWFYSKVTASLLRLLPAFTAFFCLGSWRAGADGAAIWHAGLFLRCRTWLDIAARSRT